MNSDAPVSSTATPLSASELQSLRQGSYGGVAAGSLSALFSRLRNMPTEVPTTNGDERLDALQARLLASQAPSSSAPPENCALAQQILTALRDFSSVSSRTTVPAALQPVVSGQIPPLSPQGASSGSLTFFAGFRELPASSVLETPSVARAQLQNAERAQRMVSTQLGQAGTLHLNLGSPKTTTWFHHLHTIVSAALPTLAPSGLRDVWLLLCPEDAKENERARFPKKEILQLLVASLRGYSAALGGTRGAQLDQQLETLLQENITDTSAQRINLQEIIFSHSKEAQNACFHRLADFLIDRERALLSLKSKILSLVKLFMETYREICQEIQSAASSADAPAPSRSSSPDPDLPQAGATALLEPSAGAEARSQEKVDEDEVISPENIERGVAKFVEYLQRSSELVESEIKNPQSTCTERQLLFAKDSIAMFLRIYQNWAQFQALLSSTEDVVVRQTRANNEFGVAIHLDNQSLLCNLRWVIPNMFASCEEREACVENLLDDFTSEFPCLEARTSQLLLGEDPSDVVMLATINPEKSIAENIGLYHVKYLEDAGDEAVDAQALYAWLINQNAFIGAQVLDGNITVQAVFNYLCDDPLYMNDFTDGSLEALQAQYQASLGGNG
ncbi:MAG: hypothetical protein ACRC24_02030 [Vibrionaceae bacterium]